MIKNNIPKYDFRKIEKKWQERWEKDKTNQLDLDKAKKPFYNLMMFPYPSAEGLHIGGVFTFTGVDTFGRFKRMQGYDVFEPIGLDGFGIHAENYAIKIKEHIKKVSERTEKNFYRQLNSIGNMYNWSRTVETYKPEYYKWTQWIFLQMYKKGLAYQKKAKVNWCPSCKTVLSDEQVLQGKCERCDSEVEKKELKQWFFKITEYADRLLKNLKWIDWPEDVKGNQRNWIGKSEGARIKFPISNFQFSNKSKNQNNKMEKIYFASGNKTKLKRLREIFKKIDSEIKIELVPEVVEIKEDGKDALENSYKKVEVYKGKYDVPVLAMDTAFFSEDEDIEPTHVKRVALNGKDESKMTQEEIAELMSSFYKSIAKKYNGEKEFSFEDAWSILWPNGKVDQKNYKREYILTDKEKGERDVYMPIRNIYKSKTTGKYEVENTKEEYFKEFEHQIEALGELIKLNDDAEKQKNPTSYQLPATSYLEVFTTRPDTIFGATYMVIAPELVRAQNFASLQKEIENWDDVNKYVEKALTKSEQERKEDEKSKTGVEVKGIKAINPATGKEIPIWVADYVLGDYGTGAIMAVPAHDKRDLDFANKYNLKKNIVIKKSYETGLLKEIKNVSKSKRESYFLKKQENDLKKGISYDGEGYLINSSDKFDYLHSKEVKKKIIEWLEKNKVGKKAVDYKLRDWCVSRQRYWGPPIPIIHCKKCGVVPVDEKDLPVLLPEMDDFLPEGKGKGPLAKNKEFVEVKCPRCGTLAERETDVSDPFVDSSWYFLRYPSTESNDKIFDKKRTEKWLPVDSYIGGKEHTVLHLLYSRFVTMVLNDLGYLDFDEPYKKFIGHGLITKDGAKMSKSKGNVINPDEMIEKYGADTTRLYLRFLGDFYQGGDWRDSGVAGMSKFVNRLWNTFYSLTGEGQGVENLNMLDKTIKSVGGDIEKLSFNTAVARIMELVNWINDNKNKFSEEQAREVKRILTLIIAPFVPHMAEEFWCSMRINADELETYYNASLPKNKSVFDQAWPKYNPKNIIDDEIEMAIQVNGKLRATIKMAKDVSKEKAIELAKTEEKVANFIGNAGEIKKEIFVPGRLINFVVLN